MWHTTSASSQRLAELHDARVRDLPERAEALKQRMAEGGAARPNAELGELHAVLQWFFAELHRTDLPSPATLPVWWDPAFPTAEDQQAEERGHFTRAQLALVDEMQAFISVILEAELPRSEWVVYKGHKADIKNGLTVLRVAPKEHFDVMGAVYSQGVLELKRQIPVPPEQLIKLVSRKIALGSQASS